MAVPQADGTLGVKIDYKLSRYIDPKLDRPAPMLKTLLACHPDIVNQRPLDFRSDVWSLGKVFVELLAGDLEIENHEARVDALDLPDELSVLLRVMLADDPDLRPQSMAEIAESLRRIEELPELAAAGGSTRAGARPAGRARPAPPAAGAAAGGGRGRDRRRRRALLVHPRPRASRRREHARGLRQPLRALGRLRARGLLAGVGRRQGVPQRGRGHGLPGRPRRVPAHQPPRGLPLARGPALPGRRSVRAQPGAQP